MEKFNMYFGTYTRNKSKGIYEAEILFEDNKIVDFKTKLALETGSPTYLSTYKDYVFAIEKSDSLGGITVSNINDDYTLKNKSENLSEESSGAYITYDPTSNLIMVANYHEGTIKNYTLKNDGVSILNDEFKNFGHGSLEQQESSHFHFIHFTPDRKIITADLGTDEIIFFNIDENNKFELLKRFSVPEGTGPRHIRFNYEKNIMYVLGELSSSILVYKYNTMELIQKIKTIPNNYKEFNSGAALRITDDKKFIYASNRGHNSIAAYSINSDGTLKLIENYPTGGDYPRDFNFNKQQNIIAVPHQKSDDVSFFIRKNDGTLELISKGNYLPEGVRVKFI